MESIWYFGRSYFTTAQIQTAAKVVTVISIDCYSRQSSNYLYVDCVDILGHTFFLASR